MWCKRAFRLLPAKFIPYLHRTSERNKNNPTEINNHPNIRNKYNMIVLMRPSKNIRSIRIVIQYQKYMGIRKIIATNKTFIKKICPLTVMQGKK